MPPTIIKSHALEILASSIKSVHPATLFKQKIKYDGQVLNINKRSFDLKKYNEVIVVGAGKASAAMAYELESILTDMISGGLVITNYGNRASCKRIEIKEAGHPLSDKNGLAASGKILNQVKNLAENDLAICLISGGASALMEIPVDEVSLSDLIKLNNLLLSCGAEIQEINVVRKHISQIKGGQLSKHIYPATCVSLIISDVIGDPIDIIASGPTCADTSTFFDAWRVINKYNLHNSIPAAIKSYLQNGLGDKAKETPKPGDAVLSKSTIFTIGSSEIAKAEAGKTAKSFGYKTLLIRDPVQGEASDAAKKMVDFIKKQNLDKPIAIIWGGETTVSLKGKGKGGRNQEFVLAALHEIKDSLKKPFVFLSCGTDGRDGPTDAAGAIIDELTFPKAQDQTLDISFFLKNNDSYPFFESLNALIKTGPTGANVMDIGIFLS